MACIVGSVSAEALARAMVLRVVQGKIKEDQPICTPQIGYVCQVVDSIKANAMPANLATLILASDTQHEDAVGKRSYREEEGRFIMALTSATHVSKSFNMMRF